MSASPHSLQEVFIEFTRVLQSVKASGGPKVRCSSEEGIPTPTKQEQQQQQKKKWPDVWYHIAVQHRMVPNQRGLVQKRIRQFIQVQIKSSWNTNEIIIGISDNCLWYCSWMSDCLHKPIHYNSILLEQVYCGLQSSCRLFHIMLNKRPIMPFSNAAKCSLSCHWSSPKQNCNTA